MKGCECDCFECRVNRHDICRHVIKCIKRPWTKGTRRRRSPGGRPEIGQPINIRLGDELLAAVDRMADRQGMSRAEVIRMLLTDRLAGEMSSTPDSFNMPFILETKTINSASSGGAMTEWNEVGAFGEDGYRKHRRQTTTTTADGKTTADVCAECGHTRYVHPPGDGCDISSHYYVDTCSCTGFKDTDR